MLRCVDERIRKRSDLRKRESMQAVGQLPQANTLYSIVKGVPRARTKGRGKLRLRLERMYVYNV